MSGLDEILSLDVNDLTLAEMDVLEEHTGLGFTEVFEALTKPGPKVKVLAAMAFVVKRRENPDVTFDEVMQLRILFQEPDPKE